MHHSDQPLNPEAEKQFEEAKRHLLEDLGKDAALRREAAELGLGATGQFPEGKLADHDEGQIQFAVAIYKGKVVMNFGKPVASLGMTHKQAHDLARLLLKQAGKLKAKRLKKRR